MSVASAERVLFKGLGQVTMRQIDWEFSIHRSRLGILRRAGLVLLTALFFTATMAAAPPPAAANSRYAAIVIDAKTGEVLYSRKADYRRYPASLTKVMTLYMLFDALQSGKVKLTDKIPVSRHAAGMPPSKIGIKAGEKIGVEKAIKALIVRSANDVASAVGEFLGGTEYKFALKMTKKARAIGMKRTQFRNASGLYNRHQVTTARDMATLALRIQKDFPQYYHYFQSMKVTWKNRTWPTHNHLMNTFPGADGLKTGYVRASGFNLITSAWRGNMHLVGVVMGGRRARSRDRQMTRLLNRYFARLLKRPKYVYPIADRLPDIRPKPNFAAIASKKWVRAKVGVLPRPNPFAPKPKAEDETTQKVLADIKANPPAAGTVQSGGTQAADSGSQASHTRDSGNGSDARSSASVAKEAPGLPVLAAGGTGAMPSGSGTPVPTDPQGQNGTAAQKSAAVAGKLAEINRDRDQASPASQHPAQQTPATAGSPPAAQGSGQDAIARLIEEGDGEVATNDMAGQVPADDADGDEKTDRRNSQNAKVADLAPAGNQMLAQALATPAHQWGVQLGAFTSVELAEMLLDNAQRLQPNVLTRERSALVPKEDASGKLYSARFGPMDEAEAKAACQKLKARGMHCYALASDDWGKAVRR